MNFYFVLVIRCFLFCSFLCVLLTFELYTEKNKKRDIRNWYQSANDRYNDAVEDKNRDTLRRGDIPILHGDCDGKFVIIFFTYLSSISFEENFAIIFNYII